MTRCALLVRGVNVGGKKLVMAELRALLTGLGLADVRTVLNSGNAVFTTDRTPAELEPVLEAALADGLGVRARCLVRTGAELAVVREGHPFPALATNGSRMMALLTSADPTPEQLAADDPRLLDPGHVVLGERVVYQWCPDGVLAAPDVSGLLLRRWGVAVTGRSWNTVEKLVTLTS
jgi:uncharacterized protein (DUF1697 family)